MSNGATLAPVALPERLMRVMTLLETGQREDWTWGRCWREIQQLAASTEYREVQRREMEGFALGWHARDWMEI